MCSEQFQDNDVKFVDSRTRKIERWRLSFIVFMIRRKVFRKEIVLRFLQVIVGMVVTGQEKPGINELPQGQGKVREFHSSWVRGKLCLRRTWFIGSEIHVKWNCLPSWPYPWWKILTLFFFEFFYMKKKKNSLLECRVVCCLHQSDCRIRVCNHITPIPATNCRGIILIFSPLEERQ